MDTSAGVPLPARKAVRTDFTVARLAAALAAYGLPSDQALAFLRACGYTSVIRGLGGVLQRVPRVSAAIETVTDKLPNALELVDRLACSNALRSALGQFAKEAPLALTRQLLGSDVLFEARKFREGFAVAAAIGAPSRDKRMRAADVADLVAGLCALCSLRGLDASLVIRVSSIALAIKDWTTIGRDLAPIVGSSIGSMLAGDAGDFKHVSMSASAKSAVDTLREALTQLQSTREATGRAHPPHAGVESAPDAEEVPRATIGASHADGRADSIRWGVGLARLTPRQRLAISRHALTTDETRAVVERAIAHTLSPDPRERSIGTVVLLVVATGQTPDVCMRMPLHPAAAADYVCPTGGFWSRYLPRPERAFVPNAVQASLLEEHVDRVPLALPEAAIKVLRDAVAATPEASRVAEALGIAPGVAHALVSTWLQRIDERKRRLTVARLSQLLPRVTLAMTRGDLLKVLLLTDPSPESASGFLPRGAYYAAYAASELIGDHRAALARLLAPHPLATRSTDDVQGWAGAHLRIRSDQLQQALNVLEEQVVRHRIAGNIIAHHNHLTAALLVMLQLETGARPVREPFALREEIDPENARVFLADKLNARAPAGRWVPISTSIAGSLRAYWAHLRRLHDRLSTMYPSTTMHVATLLDPRAEQRAPVFFFLGRRGRLLHVRPGRLSRYLGLLGVLPANLFRADTASRLLAAGCQYDLVDAWLGHRHYVDPLSMTSMLSARDLCDAIRPYLPVVESTLFAVGESVSGANPPMPSQLHASDNAFGSAKRAELAASRLFHLRAQVRAAIDAERQTNPERRLSAERVRVLADRVTRQNDDDVLGRAARAVLLDALARLSRRGWTVDGLPTLRRSLDPPAFPPGSPRARAFVAVVRTRFIELLGHWHGSRPTWRPAWRTAEILLSATLFGARTDPRALRNLLSAIRERQLFRRGTALIVEPGPAPAAPDQRIVVDPMTAALIAGAHARRGRHAPTSAPALMRTDYDDEVEHCLRAMLRQLGAAPPERTPVLGWWCDIAKVYWRVELGGSEWAAAEGILRPQSVATTALVRALDERRCGPVDDCEVPAAPVPRSSLEIAQPSPTLADALAWADCLRAIIHAAATLHSGTERADERTRRIELARTLAAFGRTAICPRARTNTPDRLVTMLAEWILHRTRHGGLRTDEHHTTSLYSYYTRIAVPLIELGWTSDLCALDRDQLETLFAAVMDRAPRRSQRGWLNALKSLHGSWMRLYGLPAVDWHSVAAETAMRDGVDRLPVVNWLTFAEYRCALHLLASDATSDLRLSRHTRFLLLVLFHFGLRPGEAGRLTFGQVEFDGDQLTLFIRPTTFGSLKTAASRRNVPQLQRFEADELELVRAVLRSADAEGDENALLLSAPGAPQQRYNARLVEARVVEALRAATGDPTVTLYACRHAFATRVALALAVAPPLSGLAGDIAIALWGSEEAVAHCRARLHNGQDQSPYRWDIVAELLGHADVTTAISVYANAAEFFLDLRVARVGFPAFSARMLAYVFGVSVSSVNQRHRRSGRGTLGLTEWLGEYTARFPSLDRAVRNCAGPPLLKPLDDAVPLLSVRDVDAILCSAAASSGASVRTDSIVESTLQSVERVEAVLRAATEFALETGMLDWGFYRLDGIALLSSPSRPAMPEVKRRALHRRAWLTSTLRDDVDTAPLVRAVTVWAGRFHASVPLFVVRTIDELDDIAAALQVLGISEQRLRLVWPAGVERSHGLARLIAARLPGADVYGRWLQRISRARHWRNGEVGLQVSAVAGDTAPGGRDFFRALALIWIHTRALQLLVGNARERALNP